VIREKGGEMGIRSIGFWISDVVALFVGSWWFIFTFAFFMAAWIAVNTLVYLQLFEFDRYPFILLNLVLSTLAAIQAPFIMISQRRAERKQEEANRRLLCEIKELVEIAINEEQVTHQMASDLNELVKVMIQDAQALQQIAKQVDEGREVKIVIYPEVGDLNVTSELEEGSSGCSGP
jgi:uncharacterized membrane protein